MIEPKPLPLTLQNGTEKTFILSKFPAVAGREIVAKYPLSNVPKLGDYDVSETTMLKLMAFVSIELDGGQAIPLSTRALIDNHVGDWLTLARLEFEMLEYNTGFFGKGLNSGFLTNIGPKLQAWITPILTGLSEQLLKAEKQP